MEKAFGKLCKEAEDKEILRRKRELPEQLKILTEISAKYLEVLKHLTPGTKDDATVDDIKHKYDDVVKSKEKYILDLKKVIAERELDKEAIQGIWFSN